MRESPGSAPPNRLRERIPHLSYAILERRARVGGTWDLFRYPGVWSDSDIFTLCFPWEPWTRPEMIADGGHIRDYLDQTARKHHIDEHIDFNTRVRSADWDSATDTWTVHADQGGTDKTYRARFVFFGTGYYDYDHPYPAGVHRNRGLHRRDRAPAALARFVGLHRQKSRRDRQRCDRVQLDPIGCATRISRDDVATHTVVHDLRAAHRAVGQRASQGAAGAISDGNVEVVTDHIDHMDAGGIVLTWGRHVDVDVIVTATGLQLQALGGITISIDGEKIDPHDRFMYRRHLLEDVPNMAWCMGYTNASGTLGADMTAQSVGKLLQHMHFHGYTHAYPHLGDTRMPEQPTFNLTSGYVERGLDALPSRALAGHGW